MRFVRSKITSVIEGVIKRFSGAGRLKESFTSREYFQHYGFTSRPLPGAEGIVLIQGNNIIMIASDDRRYRVALEDGEVALYTDEGDYIHFKRNRDIHINAGNKVQIDAPEVIVNAATSAKVISPDIELGLAAGHKALTNEDLITLYNSHTHPGDSGGTTGIPNQQAGAAHKTSEVKAT
jgi:phage gp45-like